MEKRRIANKNKFFFVLITLIMGSFMALGCGGGGGGSSSSSTPTTPTGTPDIAVGATQLDFGSMVLDNFADRSITVSNVGTADLRIGQVSQLSAPYSFAPDSCSNTTLAPNGSCVLTVRFNPTVQGIYPSASFTIPSNDSDENPVTVTLAGKGLGLNVSISQVDTTQCASGKLRALVTVTDRTGNPVQSIPIGGFNLTENSLAMAPLSLIPPISPPISASLVIDISASIAPYTTTVNTAAKSFINNLFPTDEAEVIKFGTKVYVLQPFISDKQSLITAVDRSPSDPGDTSLYDAVFQAVNDTALRAAGNRHAVIVLSDGGDTKSVHTLDEAIDNAIAKNIPIYAIGVGTDGLENMQTLARETGGKYYYFDPATGDLTAIYNQIALVLTNDYLLEYTTSHHGTGTVSIDVVVNSAGLEGEASRDAVGCP